MTSNKPVTLATRLGLAGVVFFGLAYMAPGIVQSTFGVVSEASHGVAPTAYLVATGAMLLTGLSYAALARRLPSAGSAYSYAGTLLGRGAGFLVGWVILLDYLFLPMVAWLIQSVYLNAQFPGVPIWGWLLLNIGLTTGINVLGIVLADRVNKALTVLALGGIVVSALVIVGYLVGRPAPELAPAIWNPGTSIVAVTSAAAIAAYSFLGFDAISTLSEETKNPRKTIPRGILLTLLIGGVIFVVVSGLMQLAHPGGTFEIADTAGYTISITTGGQMFADVLNLVGIVGGFASGLAIQATSSRLLYVMGRDGVLPGRLFGRLSHRFRVPWINVVLIGAIGLLATTLDIAQATSLINFGAFLAFTAVNISYVTLLWKTRKPVSLPLRVLASIPAVLGAIVDIVLLTQLHASAQAIGAVWLALGIGYLALVTRGFRRPVPKATEGGRSSSADGSEPEHAPLGVLKQEDDGIPDRV
ncbi:APC family permease [Saxibacter everestensis]|uniref:APC family permease n=1 Tax=Saxibacter everestensis TaxID=2909229 RepID=A0ABY8QUZ4_9MICO|nr:APC family permease [Brevibacteriaceae bacterium ZFBP1038]